ncbi:MAG: glycosyltransferase [Ketobacter sp.]|nr:MAG: glycosyltransferase [Ketobacter sp.]
MSSLIQVFAKAPLAGRVKTRIAKTLGETAALNLHKLLCDHIIQVAQTSQADEVEIWTTEPNAYFDVFAAPVWIQQGRELGTRMSFSLRHGLSRFDRVLIIGGDAYSLTPDYLNQALSALQETDVVLGPAEDGGYVLVGATQTWPVLFQKVPWGTADVMGTTLDIMLANGIGFHLLPEQWDIDTLDDLRKHAPDLLQQLEDTIN